MFYLPESDSDPTYVCGPPADQRGNRQRFDGRRGVNSGRDSLTWRYLWDWRGMLQGPWAGSMQNMHPQLGAAVIDHSTFFRERWPRLLRSLYPIGGVVFDGERAP